jgi:hypothetical protein
MNNLFNFEYQEISLANQDGTKSNFRQVFGLGGVNMACPKGSYHIVKTEDVSSLGQAFIEKGYDVSTFNHRNGEVIGLNVTFGSKMTKVGDCNYNLIITIPNNGGGKGYLSIKQLRLICTNGMISNQTMHKDNYIKIPHTWNYVDSIELMQQSIDGFTSLMTQLESRDNMFNAHELKDTEVMFHLNKWFFEQEMPASQKGKMTLDDFRRLLVENPNEIQSIGRYNALKLAYEKEIEYNTTLGLKLTMYTAYASITNYLSRRVELSGSKASDEVKTERASKKLVYFDNLI